MRAGYTARGEVGRLMAWATGPKSIYVRIEIRGPMDRLWELTQTPELHERWDLRFSEIRYLPRVDPSLPQRFLYRTRIGFGLAVSGEGETVGNKDEPGRQRTSALKFWSDDAKSLIRRGSGYWQYLPLEGEGQRIAFITGYDYQARFGAAGAIFDRVLFRPLIGWATAWSFDRLRLWIERGLDPAMSIRCALIHAIARIAIAFVWIYHGAVPKLIYRSSDELAMLRAGGLSEGAAYQARAAIGWGEVALGLVVLLAWRARWPLWLTLVLMPLAALGVLFAAPRYLVAAFNPVSLNASTFALAAIALIVARLAPSASNCSRRKGEDEP